MPWLDCDGCGRWTHIPCERTHASLNQNLDGIKFSCAACRDKIQEEKSKKKLKAKKTQSKQSVPNRTRLQEEELEKCSSQSIVEQQDLEAQDKLEQQHSDPGCSQSKQQLLLDQPAVSKKQSAVAEDLIPSTPKEQLLPPTSLLP